jgi:hypothetical protein
MKNDETTGEDENLDKREKLEEVNAGKRDAMHVPRERTRHQKAMLWATAAATLGVGLLAFFATERHPKSDAPLSFALEEQKPEATGVAFEHVLGRFDGYFENVWPFMQAVSASGCVTDFDRDGLLDLYLTNSGDGTKNKLFRNLGGFKFAHVEMPVIEDLNGDGFSSDCTFADVNNDGYDDLFVGMVGGRPRLFLNQADETTPDARLFVDFTEEANGPDYMNGFAVSFFDVERDGDLDLMVSSYFPNNYPESDIPGSPRMHPTHVPDDDDAGKMMPNDWGNATNGGKKRFFLNDGTGRFTEQDNARWGISETRFTFDIGTADINGDGWTDVYVANDFGPDQLYLNKEGKTFVDVKGRFPTDVGRDSFKGMNADLVDMDHDGYPEIYVTNVFHPVLPEGNLLWKNLPHPSGDPFLRDFKNVAADMGVKNGGWGWGARFVDIDLDGDVDILATNGYISQNPDNDYWYRLSRLVAGSKSMIVDSKRWPDFEDYSMSGHQVSHVFVKEGRRLYNRAHDAGVRRSFDGRGVVIADFDVDGRPDVLWVPQGAPYLLQKNTFVATAAQPEAPHYFGLRLSGDGVRVPAKPVGTVAKIMPAKADDENAFAPRWVEVFAGNGMSCQSMDWLLVGLGDYDGPVDVELRWTDGSSQRLEGLSPDRYHDVSFGVRTAAAGAATPGRKSAP